MSHAGPASFSFRRPKLRTRTGCNNCRDRRKKCDEIRPICTACQRLHLDCIYRMDGFFQRHDFATVSTNSSSTLVLDAAPAGQLTSQFSLSGFRDDICIAFVLDRLFCGANGPISNNGQDDTFTIRCKTQYAKPGSVSIHGLKALGMVCFGLNNHNAAVAAAGFVEHSVALEAIREAFTHSTRSRSGDVIAAIALAGLFTMMIPKYAGVWTSHCDGIASLIYAMGPETFQDPPLRRLYENNRYAMIASASVRRHPSCFDCDEWKTIPWAQYPKSDFQRLLDIYARVPSVDWLFDRLVESESSEAEAGIKAKLETCIDRLLEDLHSWRESMEPRLNAEMVVLTEHDASMLDFGISRSAVRFDSLNVTFALAIYNMILIVVCGYMYSPHLVGTETFQAEKSASNTPESNSPEADCREEAQLCRVLPFSSPVQRALRAGEEVAQLIPWTTRDAVLGAGSLYMFAPATLAYHLFKVFNQTKAMWLIQQLRAFGSVWGSLGSRDVQIRMKQVQEPEADRDPVDNEPNVAAKHPKASEYST